MKSPIIRRIFHLGKILASDDGSDLVEFVLIFTLVALGVTSSMAVAAGSMSKAFEHAANRLSISLAQSDPQGSSGGGGGGGGSAGGSGGGQGSGGDAGSSGGGGQAGKGGDPGTGGGSVGGSGGQGSGNGGNSGG
ncbi:MAG: hypothetical protein WB608_02345, partial [Terracidiphilus sp.]